MERTRSEIVNKPRIRHIDIAKAIGMMLIITSHVWTTPELSESYAFKEWDAVLNSFYVPLFFLLSGVFEPSSNDWMKYWRRLAKLGKFLVIFALFGFLSTGVVRGQWTLGACLTGTAIWFLIVLMLITAMFGVIKLCKYSLLACCILGCVGYLLAINGHSYFYLGQSLLCIPFYAVGYKYKGFFKRADFNLKLFAASTIVWIVCMFCFYRAPQNISLNMVTQSLPSFYLSAFCGSIVVIELCKLSSNKLIAYYGRNSIVPMMVQMAFIWIAADIILADNMLVYFLEAIVVSVVCGACIPLARNKYYDIFK